LVGTKEATPSLLVCGSDKDLNLDAIIASAGSEGVRVFDARFSSSTSPEVGWDLNAGNILRLDGRAVAPTAAFVRYDVFLGLSDPRPVVHTRALGWYQAISGWLDANPEVTVLNRWIRGAAGIKLAVLHRAKGLGIRIPDTILSNERSLLTRTDVRDLVAKPAAGGGFCLALAEAMAESRESDSALPMPAIIQERLGPPEIRVYCVGDKSFAFRIASDRLDYRTDPQPKITWLDTVPRQTRSIR
jgi:hypothetical protein